MATHARTASIRTFDGFEVLDAFHRQMCACLAQLSELAARVGSGVADEECRSLARSLKAFFGGPARQHNLDEERHVFPSLFGSGDASLVHMAERLYEQHAWMELYWLDVEKHLDAVAGGDRLPQFEHLRSATGQFVTLSQQHVTLEESLLYPQARRQMSLRARRSLARKLAASSGSGPTRTVV
jgi:hemerythrin-like domain-containing protein